MNNATKDRDDTGSYRIPVAVQFAVSAKDSQLRTSEEDLHWLTLVLAQWSIIICTGLLFLPETPRFLIKKDKHEKAAKALSRLRRLDPTHPALVEELAEIEANHRYEMSIAKAGYIDCFKGTIGTRLLTGCLLQALQQLTGEFGTFRMALRGLCLQSIIPTDGYSFDCRCQLYLLLRHAIFHQCRLQQPLHH